MGTFFKRMAVLSACLMVAYVVLLSIQYVQLHASNDSLATTGATGHLGSRSHIDIGTRSAWHTRGNSQVNIYNYSEKPFDNFKCVNLHAMNVTTPICIYNVTDDIFVSGSIKARGIFEKEHVETMSIILEDNPEMELLDIGCNIGVYTLFAAKFGRKVVAVDANRNNLQRLGKSLKLGDLSGKTTLVWNGISDGYEMLTMSMPKNNNGAGMLLPAKSTDEKKVSIDFLINTITIEDIMPLVKNKTIFMKMDIEGFEHRLLRAVRHFFDYVDIPYIQMEFMFYNSRPAEAVEIITFFRQRGYTPFQCNKEMDMDKFKRWPKDILWVRKSHLNKPHCKL